MAKREPDSEEFIRPQRQWVDVLEVDGHATLEKVYKLEQLMCNEMPNLEGVCDRQSNSGLGKLVGTTGETIQSNPLALTQLLITYHMLKAPQIRQ